MTTTTTTYGTWNNFGDRWEVTVEGTVLSYIGGAPQEWVERVEESGAFDAMVAHYRIAINRALPDGVSLVGDEFYGPYYEADHTWDGELDIAEIIEGVDLGEIVDHHDPDLQAE